MFDFILKKNRPDYWKSYVECFKRKRPKDLNAVRFVVFDTETTGLNLKEDRILSIGAIAVIGNTIDVSDSFEVYLKQNVFNPETVEIHGILRGGHIHKMEEKEAVVAFLEYIEDAILIAHHAAFDIGMINSSLARMNLPKLKNRVLDTGVLFRKTQLFKDRNPNISLDRLCEIFQLKMHDRHTASGDAFLTALIFLKTISSIKGTGNLSLKDLFFNSDRRGLL